MSTRSYIGIEHPNKKIEMVYCHSDGYVSHNGIKLLSFYNNSKAVEKIMKLGFLYFLDNKLTPKKGVEHAFYPKSRQKGVSLFFKRDRGDTDVDSLKWDSLDHFLKEGLKDAWDIEYVYLFKNNRWHLLHKGKFVVLSDLIDDLIDKEKNEA